MNKNKIKLLTAAVAVPAVLAVSVVSYKQATNKSDIKVKSLDSAIQLSSTSSTTKLVTTSSTSTKVETSYSSTGFFSALSSLFSALIQYFASSYTQVPKTVVKVTEVVAKEYELKFVTSEHDANDNLKLQVTSEDNSWKHHLSVESFKKEEGKGYYSLKLSDVKHPEKLTLSFYSDSVQANNGKNKTYKLSELLDRSEHITVQTNDYTTKYSGIITVSAK